MAGWADLLWQSCDQLRGGMDASQYKDYVLTLLFMKYVSDKYAGERRLRRHQGASRGKLRRHGRAEAARGRNPAAFGWRCILAGRKPEHAAEETTRYETLEGALACLIEDFRLSGIRANPDHPSLFNGHQS